MRFFDRLSTVADLSAVRSASEAQTDAFDAVVCVVAGADFLKAGTLCTFLLETYDARTAKSPQP